MKKKQRKRKRKIGALAVHMQKKESALFVGLLCVLPFCFFYHQKIKKPIIWPFSLLISAFLHGNVTCYLASSGTAPCLFLYIQFLHIDVKSQDSLQELIIFYPFLVTTWILVYVLYMCTNGRSCFFEIFLLIVFLFPFGFV